MSEIKFRAWYKGHMYYSDSHEDAEIIGLKVGELVFSGFMAKFHPLHLGQNVVLEQFIGLQDKNGVDIYEADKIKDEFGFTKEVRRGYCNFNLIDHDVSYDMYQYVENYINHGIIVSSIEVVGNIHEETK